MSPAHPPPTTKHKRYNNSANSAAAAAAAATGASLHQQDSYFHGYYPSSKQNHQQQHHQQDYYSKCEIEFAHHQQQQQNHSKPMVHGDFQHGPQQLQSHKSEFHHIKAAGDFHHGKIGDLTALAKGTTTTMTPPIDFHGKNSAAANFHASQQHSNYYNNQPPSSVTTPANHVAIQYVANQYYHGSDYDGAPEPSYYDPTKGQSSYYENMNYHVASATAEYPGGGSTVDAYSAAAMAAATAVISAGDTDNCNSFVYPSQQYYEGPAHIQQHPQQQHLQQQQHQHHQLHQQHHQVGPVHNQHVSAQQQQQQLQQQHPQQQQQHQHQFNHHGPPQPYSAHGVVVGNGVGVGHNNLANHMDNSNSSSDFNFLSNLANDFAPEYYQLS